MNLTPATSGRRETLTEGGAAAFTGGRLINRSRGIVLEEASDWMYVVNSGEIGVSITRNEAEKRSSRKSRRFANSTDETKWPMAGVGMNTSSNFFIVMVDNGATY
ncbi:hypothetical protein COLO4_34341 [Corchorus olitorius]|uniref:Uncharacterized protein n=1 Tax=Corchorus olitorius TaxID=93759 RepID=A0A1R3GLI1_9ROSI|nr:hypothetical protein COLO4_34341 [Corchorus olitorius]